MGVPQEDRRRKDDCQDCKKMTQSLHTWLPAPNLLTFLYVTGHQLTGKTILVLMSIVLALAARPTLGADGEETTVKVTITNGGNDVKGYGTFSLHPAGQRGKQVAASSSGATVTVPAGDYEIRVRYTEGAASKDTWLPKESFNGSVEKSVEIDMPLARANFHVTNNGEEAGPAATYTLYSPGDRKKELGYAASGESATIPAGVYDVLLRFSDGVGQKSVWMLKQKLDGTVEQSMDVGSLPEDPPPKTAPPETQPKLTETRPLPPESLPTETRPIISETAPAVQPETVPVAPPETAPVVPPETRKVEPSLPQPPDFLIPVPGPVPQTPGKSRFGCGLIRGAP